MKKFKYLLMGALVSMMGINMVEALGNPKFDIDITPTVNSDNTVSVDVVIKNDGSSTYGVKQGKVYVYLDENLITSATNITGIYNDYNEVTSQYGTNKNMSCSYDGANHRVICEMGRIITNPQIVNYSDANDKMHIIFSTELCENSTDCNIRVEVEGEVVDPDNNYSSVSNGVTTLATKNADCMNNTPNTPITPDEPDEPIEIPDEPNENPNTVDSGIVYMLTLMLSFVLIVTVLTTNKKRHA